MTKDVEYQARRIAREVAETGAGRVVLRTADAFVFAKPEVDSITEKLRYPGVYKYKLQERQANQWRDIQTYRKVRAPAMVAKEPLEIVAMIDDGEFDELRSTPITDVISAIHQEPRRYKSALKGLHRSTFLEFAQRRKTRTLTAAADFLTEINQKITHPASEYLGTVFELQRHIKPEDLAEIFSSTRQESLFSKIRDKAEDYLTSSSAPSRMGAAGMLGKLASMTDRESAAPFFRTLLRSDPGDLLDSFYLEEGAHTYFETKDLLASESKIAEGIRNSISPIEIATTQNTFSVVIAMDRSFFRIYSPQILFYAQQLPEIDFSILLCGGTEQIERLVKDGREFERSLVKLNNVGSARNIHYYHIPVPSLVQDNQTFYASARFFSAELLLERYQTIYLMDADLSTDVDPRPYFKEISNLGFAVPRMPGINYLYPWRRYMAGNVVMNREALESGLTQDLQRYLVHGLQFKKSWTLDQNALSYAIERHPEVYTELNSFNRPFYQNTFRVSWEKRYAKLVI